MLSGEADYYRNYYEYYYSKTEIPKYMLLRTCLASLFVICFIQVNGQIRIYIVQWLIFIFHCASQYRLAHIIANSTWTQWRMLSCCFYVIWSGIYYLQYAFRRLKTIRTSVGIRKRTTDKMSVNHSRQHAIALNFEGTGRNWGSEISYHSKTLSTFRRRTRSPSKCHKLN